MLYLPCVVKIQSKALWLAMHVYGAAKFNISVVCERLRMMSYVLGLLLPVAVVCFRESLIELIFLAERIL